MHIPGSTTDLTILHVLLRITTARIHADAHLLTTIRTGDLGLALEGRVAFVERFVEVVIGAVSAIIVIEEHGHHNRLRGNQAGS
jgi:hypothetical protein